MSPIIQTCDYDANHSPSMPVLEIGLSQPADSNPMIVLKGIVDTGSDATTIPTHFLKQIRAKRRGKQYLVGINGLRREVTMYLVAVYIILAIIVSVEPVLLLMMSMMRYSLVEMS